MEYRKHIYLILHGYYYNILVINGVIPLTCLLLSLWKTAKDTDLNFLKQF